MSRSITMGKKSQKTAKFERKVRSPKSLEKQKQTSISSLKKKASELEILCGAQVCCIFEGPTGNVKLWPENQSDAISVITKYKQCNKKTKLYKEIRRSKSMGQLEKNKGLAMSHVNSDQTKPCSRSKSMGQLEENMVMGHVDSEQSSNTPEDFEKYLAFDIDQLQNTLTEDDFEDQHNCLDIGDDVDQFCMCDFTVGNVEPNTYKGFDMAQYLNSEENKDSDEKNFDIGNEGLDNLSEESSMHMSDFLSSNMDITDQKNASVEGDEYDQQVEYHGLNTSSDSLHVQDNIDVIDHEFDQILKNFLGDTTDELDMGFPECSRSNAHMSTVPGYDHHHDDNICGMRPCKTLWPSPHFSGLEGAYKSSNYSTNFENEDNNIRPFLSSLDEQPKLMGSNKCLGDIGRN